jgi:hypothetical protein
MQLHFRRPKQIQKGQPECNLDQNTVAFSAMFFVSTIFQIAIFGIAVPFHGNSPIDDRIGSDGSFLHFFRGRLAAAGQKFWKGPFAAKRGNLKLEIFAAAPSDSSFREGVEFELQRTNF